MSNNPFVKAEKSQLKLRLAIDGPTGSGKTYTALVAATVMAQRGKIAVIDTERKSAALYSDKFPFDVAALEKFSPQNYIDLIEAAEEAGYDVIVIDSLSHAWEGEGGALDMVDAAQKRSQSGNSFTAWKDVTPIHRRLIDAMVQSKCHIIATMRSKMDYALEKDEKTGRNVVRKLGLAPVQRQGMEYEFTIVGDMDTDHNLVITKSRCEFIADEVVNKPNTKFFQKILDWLNTGAIPSPISEPKPEFKQPAPAPALAKANGNGNGADLPSQINAMGEQLYPGCWPDRKKGIANAYQADGKTDLKKVLNFLTKRKDSLADPEQLSSHVAKNWPGYEDFILEVINAASDKFDRMAFLRGVADAFKASAADDNIDNAIKLNIILAAMNIESAIPEEFR